VVNFGELTVVPSSTVWSAFLVICSAALIWVIKTWFTLFYRFDWEKRSCVVCCHILNRLFCLRTVTSHLCTTISKISIIQGRCGRWSCGRNCVIQ
jgi:hypothetical protein